MSHEHTAENDAGEREEFSLPEQRHRMTVAHGGISATHVVHYSTFPSGKHEGRWVRRACDRRALCGSLSACVVGIDAADWPTVPQPVDDFDQVTCKRCRERYPRIIPPGSTEVEARPE